MFKALRQGLLLLILVSPGACSGASSGQIQSVAISPDGEIIAVDFGKDGASFIYKVRRVAQP